MNLQKETKAAELRAKLALADEATSLAHRNTKLLDLEAMELDSKCNLRLSKSRSPSPRLACSIDCKTARDPPGMKFFPHSNFALFSHNWSLFFQPYSHSSHFPCLGYRV